MSYQLLQEAAVRSGRGSQVGVGAAFHHPPPVEHDDLVGIPDGAQPVGEDQTGTSTAADVRIDVALGDGVKRTCGLIQDEYGGVHGQRAGDFQALALPAGEVTGLLPHPGRVKPTALGHHVGDTGVLKCKAQLRIADMAVPQREVVADTPGEEVQLLIHIGDR